MYECEQCNAICPLQLLKCAYFIVCIFCISFFLACSLLWFKQHFLPTYYRYILEIASLRIRLAAIHPHISKLTFKMGNNSCREITVDLHFYFKNNDLSRVSHNTQLPMQSTVVEKHLPSCI